MGLNTTMTAMLKCPFGAAPGVLIVLPISRTISMIMPAATMMDGMPFMNILPFGMCMSMANPMVAMATIAALGVLTPMPCIPMTFAPWVPPCPTVLVGSLPTISNTAKRICLWGGVIQQITPGQFTVLVPV